MDAFSKNDSLDLIFPKFSFMIEHMSNIILGLARFTYIIWPLFVIVAFAYSLQGHSGKRWFKSLVHRVEKNLFYTWLILFLVWLVTLFAEDATPSIIPEPANSLIFFVGFAILVIIEVIQMRLFPIRILARMDLHQAQALDDLQKMRPDQFEELVAETYRSLGYKARHVGHTGDHGIDVEVSTPQGERWIIQCKRYNDSVGESIIRDLYGTMVSEHANRAVLVTSAEITPPAQAWARGKPIDLVDGTRLLALIDEGRRKTDGSFFDRFTHWLMGIFRPQVVPAGLRTSSQAARQTAKSAQPHSPPILTFVDETQPVRLKPVAVTVRSAAPICPSCGAPMLPHPTHPGRNLYRCSNYPNCRVVLQQ